ncbi:hypothetical protein QJS83_03070 [Bdellovibrio sp. 22V]|uniref:hypothetical protein n=1 Tax=Bdellovibrio TaxID=958 RepID=UPI0025427D76|nr:hypothetical protein [Bdellovibrio sp. 22V]WII72850.1 hypothetical protein QJS83_03070 [Bdellovibrio sp. 22V]
MTRLFLPLLLLVTSTAQARVFNINKETFAAYFLATGGGSALGDSAVKGESGATIGFSEEVKYNYSGEFGFLYSRPQASLRFGFEILKPQTMNNSTANNGTDDLYTASSDLLGYAPKLTLEVNLQRTNTYRSFVSLTGGYANVTMKNDYTLTAAGQTAFPGVSDHAVEAKGSGTLLGASLGYEGIMTDTTTVLVEFGYRQLKVDNLEYTKSVTTFSGAKNSGDPVLTSSGSKRELDFSGAFISIGFRFYL